MDLKTKKTQFMKSKSKIEFTLALFILLLALLTGGSSQIKKRTPKDLPPKYRQWLEEEVVYIISPKEKEVFLQLESDRERELFIEGFWKQRDPNPSTPENEFKKEHYRRLDYVNKHFGRDTPGPGWRTDMGRIYIILGEPKTVEAFENLSECYPVVVWFYDGMSQYGLPNSFYVVFFKEGGSGDYKLYSPIRYGPQYLLVHYYGDMADYEKAYRQLYEVNPLLAEVSLNLIPAEAQTLTPSIASEVLIASRIPSVPHEMVKPTWAEKLLAYKDIVEVEYSANYIESDSQVDVIYDSSGIYFIHYLIEPKRLTFEQIGNRYYCHLEANGIVTDKNGQIIYQFSRSTPIEMTAERLDKVRAKLFSFQDVFPLIPGRYQFHVILKNRVSKEFTSLEKEIEIPEKKSLFMSQPILANRLERESKYKGNVKPYLCKNIQLVPSPRNDFIREDNLFIYFQIINLPPSQSSHWSIEYLIKNENQNVVFNQVKEIRNYSDLANIFEEIALKDFAPAHYWLQVRLLNGKKEEVISRQARFSLSPAAFLARPWVLSFPQPPAGDPMYANIIGNQWWNKNNPDVARFYLEKAFFQAPNVAKYGLDYANLLLKQKEYQQAKKVALAFIETEERNNFLSLLGQACQAIDEYEEAIKYYQEYLSHFGTNLPILNSLGECYYRLGQIEEALKIWHRSLEIDPKQETLRKMVESIKNKK